MMRSTDQDVMREAVRQIYGRSRARGNVPPSNGMRFNPNAVLDTSQVIDIRRPVSPVGTQIARLLRSPVGQTARAYQTGVPAIDMRDAMNWGSRAHVSPTGIMEDDPRLVAMSRYLATTRRRNNG